jgi:molybdopterin molybdotransferase
MDGYALSAAKAGARLTVLGVIMAGDAPMRSPRTGGAWRIMTGAPMPAGCDAVIPVEDTLTLDGGSAVELLAPVQSGDFVRGRGRDFSPGSEICPAGTRLGPRHLMALAAAGVERAAVWRRPRVALIATGRELAPAGVPLAPGQIRDASSAYLAAALPAFGADFQFGGVVADDPADFKARLEALFLSGTDVVLTTGAVSMGEADFIPKTIADMGAEALFHKTAIRPGKPILFARFPNGPLFFGLPGNPVSTVVGARFFVEPCLRELLRRPRETHGRAALARGVDKPEGLRCFYKARRTPGGTIEILPGQASFHIHSLLSADCWAVLPEEGEQAKEGAEIDVYPLQETFA